MNENYESTVFAGGCFWCTEAVFQRIEGVEKVVSDYTGGHIKNPAYREVCQGTTGHAEGIEITFDPTKVSYETLLELFFATHDPTAMNQQGNDRGTQYRSAIFYASAAQKAQAENFIKLLTDSKVFPSPIVTQLEPLGVFYQAGLDHQIFFNDNNEQPYCQFIIAPKIKKITQHYAQNLKKD